MKKVFVMCVLVMIYCSAYAENVVFNNPEVDDYGLDYCREWGKNCGKPAADEFCRLKGYPKALDFKWVKDNQKTRVITSGQVCDAAYCDRISQVVCYDPAEKFYNPEVNGYGLDYCREWGKNCGKPAADEFCKSKGYKRAKDFKWVKDNQKTRVITSRQVCDADYCDRISEVTCTD